MFKVNNKDTRTYFTPCSNVCIVNFEHVIAGWEMSSFSCFPFPNFERIEIPTGFKYKKTSLLKTRCIFRALKSSKMELFAKIGNVHGAFRKKCHTRCLTGS